MKTISLTRGRVAFVDDEDFERLSRFKWSYANCGYAVRGVWNGRKTFYMHREIIDIPKGLEPDHINRNKLDNRRSNLRLCSHRQNSWNCDTRKHNKLGVRGVDYDSRRDKYRAQICVHGKRLFLGRFDTLAEAKSAYDQAAVLNFGEFYP